MKVREFKLLRGFKGFKINLTRGIHWINTPVGCYFCTINGNEIIQQNFQIATMNVASLNRVLENNVAVLLFSVSIVNWSNGYPQYRDVERHNVPMDVPVVIRAHIVNL